MIFRITSDNIQLPEVIIKELCYNLEFPKIVLQEFLT